MLDCKLKVSAYSSWSGEYSDCEIKYNAENIKDALYKAIKFRNNPDVCKSLDIKLSDDEKDEILQESDFNLNDNDLENFNLVQDVLLDDYSQWENEQYFMYYLKIGDNIYIDIDRDTFITDTDDFI